MELYFKIGDKITFKTIKECKNCIDLDFSTHNSYHSPNYVHINNIGKCLIIKDIEDIKSKIVSGNSTRCCLTFSLNGKIHYCYKPIRFKFLKPFELPDYLFKF